MRAGLNKEWLLLFGILTILALAALSIIVLEPTSTNRSSVEAAQQATNETTQTSSEARTTDCSSDRATHDACYQGDHQEAATKPTETREVRTATKRTDTGDVRTANCSAASAPDYLCYQQRYRDLVRTYGVEAAFAELKIEVTTNEFARSNCHLITHFIGRAATDHYGDDTATVFSRGDSYCGSGYYHGGMEAIVEKIGPVKILHEANTLCANLGRDQGHSFNHYNCAHGLGHGFMHIEEGELFESLKTCDRLADDWERNRCYGGVFMENVVASTNPGHSSKYLRADQPLYPCDVVGTRYKNECYQRQTSYALQMRGNDFSRVFKLCAKVEDDFQPSCYQGLGWDASVQSLKQGTSYAVINESTSMLCLIGEDHTAQFNCVVGAVDYFIRDSYNTTRARAFCEYFGASLRAMCLQEAEEYYATLQSPQERRGRV